MSRRDQGSGAGRHELFFALLMLVFVATLIYLSFGLTRSPRLLPQLVGIPTLLFLIYQLLRDSGLIKGSNSEPRSVEDRSSGPEIAGETTDGMGDMSVASLSAALDEKQREEGHEEDEVDEEGRRRMVIFTLWCLALVVGAALTSFLVVTPFVLLAILYYGTRRVLFSIISTAITCGFIWFVFESFLGVRF